MESSSREAPSWLQKGRDWLEAMRLSVAATSPAAAARGVTVETEQSQGARVAGMPAAAATAAARRRRGQETAGVVATRRSVSRAVLRRRSTGRSRDTRTSSPRATCSSLRAGTPAPWR